MEFAPLMLSFWRDHLGKHTFKDEIVYFEIKKLPSEFQDEYLCQKKLMHIILIRKLARNPVDLLTRIVRNNKLVTDVCRLLGYQSRFQSEKMRKGRNSPR